MNERLRQRIENFAGADRGMQQLMPDTGINSGMQLMPDIRRDGLPKTGMQLMPDIRRDGPVTDREGAMQLLEQIEALGGNVSEGERRLFMNMSPEELNNMSMDFTRGTLMDALSQNKGSLSNREYNQLLDNMSFEDGVELSRKLNRVQPETSTFQQQLRNARMNDLMDALSQNKGSLSNREAQYLIENFDVDIDGRDYQFEGEGGLDLMGLRQRLGLEPMYDATGTEFDEVMVMPEAEALSQMGRGPDTELAHLEPGDVVIPPAVLENDPMLADVLEERMSMAGVDPASRIAGVGIASLNPNTGLEEFGLFKSILKVAAAPLKVTKKVVKSDLFKTLAPIAANFIPIPGVGPLAAMAIRGAIGGVASGKGLKGAALGAAMSAAGGAMAGMKPGMAPALAAGTKITPQNYFKATAFGKNPFTSAKSGIAALTGGSGGSGGGVGKLLGGLGGGSLGGGSLGGGGGLGGLLGGGGQQGGMGGGLGMGGLLAAGLPAAFLAKKAYDEAKEDYGVPMTPMTQFDSMGRYNIEAEIARRMGKEQPNPVEFGLLPELPQLSGGAPIEQPVQKAAYGGPIMAFAEGGDVALEDFERMSGDINGAGTETSDDIPAMLSDGEFVMTGKSVRGAGAFEMTKGEGGIITLVPSLEEDKQRGTDLMYQMMNEFSNYAQPI